MPMSVIQFPTKTVRQKRLTQALAKIEEALILQREAIKEFRKINIELGKEMAELRVNMKSFQTALAGINVRPLRKNSLRLATLMANCEKA
jgi:hypothetical protein